MSKQEALKELESLEGSHYDPEMVQVLKTVLEGAD
jgi:response regulator RpfG family c-di-GMP phosphodiesterase